MLEVENVDADYKKAETQAVIHDDEDENDVKPKVDNRVSNTLKILPAKDASKASPRGRGRKANIEVTQIEKMENEDDDDRASVNSARVVKTRIASKSPMTKNLGKVDKLGKFERTLIEKKEDDEDDKGKLELA